MSGIEHLISNAIYGDMVERGKPEPDIFLKAAELIGQDPKECLVLEDSAPGLLAGKAAGGYTIYVPDIAVVSKEAKEGITAELADLHEVAAWIRKENKSKKENDCHAAFGGCGQFFASPCIRKK